MHDTLTHEETETHPPFIDTSLETVVAIREPVAQRYREMPNVRKLTPQEVRELEATAEPPGPADSVEKTSHDSGMLDDAYPRLAAWVYERGWIEIGQDHYSRSFIRVLDEGGMVWEGVTRYPSLGAALRAADTALHELEAAGEL
jgi:hypothetical protein